MGQGGDPRPLEPPNPKSKEASLLTRTSRNKNTRASSRFLFHSVR